ncbi:MAG: amidohydrolase family protein [Verrucomicrobiales bacterium]|nr:amidohydrolase family protein [Verrucomicrobiales bacterium]
MTLVRSRILLPITAPPIEDGAVLISGSRIQTVGRWSELSRNHAGVSVDLGDTVLLPGLVNAHCHLDYSNFAGFLAPQRHFTDWIQGVLPLKAQWGFSEYAASWLNGARQLLASGCTTVLDIEAVPELLPDSWQTTPLHVMSALEMTGVRSGRPAAAVLAEALVNVDRLSHPRCRVALAPHAPYSTLPDLLALTAQVARQRSLPVTIHVGESADEFEMFVHARGRMYDWLRPQRDLRDCGHGTPLSHVARQGLLGPHTLVAHLNYLGEGDLEWLASSGASVVHCPRSHAYFGHQRFPYDALRRAGVRVCLGTDSLLTMRKNGRWLPQLNFQEELTEAVWTLPDTKPSEVLRLATVEAAEALGGFGSAGALRSGVSADLAVAPYGGSIERVHEALVTREARIEAVMIAGRWVHGPRAEAVPEGSAS